MCESNQRVSIPDYTVLDNAAIVSDCRIGVGSDVQMTDVVLASLSGVNGINVQAGGDITLTSNNMFGLCSGGAPNLFTVAYYRLVH